MPVAWKGVGKKNNNNSERAREYVTTARATCVSVGVRGKPKKDTSQYGSKYDKITTPRVDLELEIRE